MHQLQCSKVVIHWLFQMLAKAGRTQRLFSRLKRSSHSRSLSHGSFPQRTHFHRKIKHIIIFSRRNSLKSIWSLKDPKIHYVRYGERPIIAIKGAHLLVKKCRYYLLIYAHTLLTVNFKDPTTSTNLINNPKMIKYNLY